MILCLQGASYVRITQYDFMKTLIEDKTVPPQMLLDEIGKAARFGIQNSLVYSAVIEYGKRLNAASVDAHFTNVRFLVQALQQRDIQGDSAVEDILNGSEEERNRVRPLLVVSTDLKNCKRRMTCYVIR